MNGKPALKKPLSISEFREKRTPLRHVTADFTQNMRKADKIAMWVTQRVGTIGFFFIIALWTALWLGWNLLAPRNLQFDPPMGFVFWLFISNLIQLMLMPLIMVGQNVQGRYAEARAEHDLEVNVKAEAEIEVILEHLEYQNQLLIAMIDKLGISVSEIPQ